jgi:hypothetical protein
MLSLGAVHRDPIASRALEELSSRYSVSEERGRLVLTHKTAQMKLFLHDLNDLHQWYLYHADKLKQENGRLRVFGCAVIEQREKWKSLALGAESKLWETNRSEKLDAPDTRYAALKRYLAKQFHPDYSLGRGIEKAVRNEIFKEIWSEIGRLDQQLVETACPEQLPW